jgi:tellurite methyltransferase
MPELRDCGVLRRRCRVRQHTDVAEWPLDHPDDRRMGPTLRELFGDIDIYLFDQIARGHVTREMRILDAGCGNGRNIHYFMRFGHHVAGVDESAAAVDATRRLAERMAPRLSGAAFRHEPVERMSFGDAEFDFVISSAVLHFARDAGHFRAMLDGMWRVLRPRGILFARLASTIGMPAANFHSAGNGRFRLPDGAERFLVDEAMLMNETRRLGAELVDPIKTTVVQGARCMTTWCLRKVPSLDT